MKRVTYWPQAWLGMWDPSAWHCAHQNHDIVRRGDEHDIPRCLERTSCATPSRIWGAYLRFVVVSYINVFVRMG